MFAIGDMIVYGSDGVFVVSEYASSPIDKHDDRVFYVLRPVYGNVSNLIYTPADNQRVMMRGVMTRDEALSFIDTIPKISLLYIENEKKRRVAYRDALNECDNEYYVKIIKTVRKKREECQHQRKRLSESDEEFEKKAKHCLYGELAVSLGMSFNEFERYILTFFEEKTDMAM